MDRTRKLLVYERLAATATPGNPARAQVGRTFACDWLKLTIEPGLATLACSWPEPVLGLSLEAPACGWLGFSLGSDPDHGAVQIVKGGCHVATG